MTSIADLIAAYQPDLGGILYDQRVPIGIAVTVVTIIGLVAAYRLRWFAAARRHPARSGVLALTFLAVALPVGFYLASPLIIRSTLNEVGPVAAAPSPAPSLAPVTPSPDPSIDSTTEPSPAATPTHTASPFAPTVVSTGEFTGTDDFHFGSGTASIIETTPGRYVLRLEDFSVRNGPDLFVYLSPDADGYADDALELDRLKATDGSFNYELPAGTNPADFTSALIWCKQFSQLFAVAPLIAG